MLDVLPLILIFLYHLKCMREKCSIDFNIFHLVHTSVHLPRDGLSIERLTLLGWVHLARVMVDSYTLSAEPALDTPLSTPRSRARASQGKPPRPQTPKTK